MNKEFPHNIDYILKSMSECDIDSFALSVIIKKFWGNIINTKVLPKIKTIYDKLVEHNYTENNVLEFNDGDDTICYIPHKFKNIIVHTMQNKNYLYVLDCYGFYVHEFFHVYEPPTEKWEIEDHKALDNMETAIQKSYVFTSYADSYEKNIYPHRPSLSWFKNNDFNMGAWIGQVLSYCNIIKECDSEFNKAELICNCYIDYIFEELVGSQPT